MTRTTIKLLTVLFLALYVVLDIASAHMQYHRRLREAEEMLQRAERLERDRKQLIRLQEAGLFIRLNGKDR